MTDEVKAAVAIIVTSTLIYKSWVDYYREKKFSRWLSDSFFRNACDSIQTLAETAQKLSQLEDIVNDIQHKPDDRSVNMSIPDALSGIANSADISNANPLAVLEIVEPERDRMRSSLLEDLHSILQYGVTQTDYNDMKKRFDNRDRGGLPNDVLFVDHKSGFHYRDGFISNPDGDFQAAKYNSLSAAQRKVLAKRLYDEGAQSHDDE